ATRTLPAVLRQQIERVRRAVKDVEFGRRTSGYQSLVHLQTLAPIDQLVAVPGHQQRRGEAWARVRHGTHGREASLGHVVAEKECHALRCALGTGVLSQEVD